MRDAIKNPQALVIRSVAPWKMGAGMQVCLLACARTSLLTLRWGASYARRHCRCHPPAVTSAMMGWEKRQETGKYVPINGQNLVLLNMCVFITRWLQNRNIMYQ